MYCKFLFYIPVICLVFSCTQAPEKPVELVKELIAPSADEKSQLPYLFSNKDHTILSWVTQDNDKESTLYYSELIGGEWNEAKEIVHGNDWFVNWADFPAIAENNGNLLAHHLKKSSNETFSYDVKLNTKGISDKQWTTSRALHSDATKTEHGFVSMVPYKTDSFFVTWLDGRNTGGGGHGGGHHGAMSIRAAEVTPDGTILNEMELDHKTCDCCQTTAAITSNGPVVIYRDRSDKEVRDISIVRMVDGSWTEPKTVFHDNWEIKGCPVNGPSAASFENNLVISWFTAVSGEPKVNLVFSDNGGEHFDDPIVISDKSPIGRVDIAMIDGENCIVSWLESTGEMSELKVVKIHRSGKKSDELNIAELTSSRKSGFPQMELVREKLIFAWTHVEGENSFIKTAEVLTDNFKYK